MQSSFLYALAGYAVGTALVALLAPETPEHKGRALAERAAAAQSGFVGESSQIAIRVRDAHGQTINYAAHQDIVEGKTNGSPRSHMVIMDGEGQMRVEIVSGTTSTSGDQQWLRTAYDDEFHTITAAMRPVPVVGSQLCLEDLQIQSASVYDYEFIGEQTLEGKATWQLARFPPADRSRYSKHIVWLDKDMLQPVRIDYYNHRNIRVKTATYSRFVTYGPFSRASAVVFHNEMTGEVTTMVWQSRQFGIKPPDELFRVLALATQ